MMSVAMLVVLAGTPRAHVFSLDLLSTGIGTWAVFPHESGARDASLFSKTGISAYATVRPVKLFASVPLAYTVVYKDGAFNDYRIAPGDLKFYAGLSVFEILEPRLGFSIPLYKVGGVWIGSGNATFQAGLALNPTVRETRRWTTTAEAMIDFSLPGTNAYADAGSFVIPFDIKGTFKPRDAFKTGVEILGSAGHMYWPLWNEGVENSFSLVPHLFCEFRVHNALYASFKAGAGPFWRSAQSEPSKLTLTGINTNVSISANYYP